jgi:hypothetical protein
MNYPQPLCCVLVSSYLRLYVVALSVCSYFYRAASPVATERSRHCLFRFVNVFVRQDSSGYEKFS